MKSSWVITGIFLVLLVFSNPSAAQQHQKNQRIEFQPERIIKKLPATISETSGLLRYKNYFITHNDSGGTPELFLLDSLNGKIVFTHRIANAINFDWEDIAMDDFYLYIGDFGNNLGNRTNLCIYRILLENLAQASNKPIPSEEIRFTYPDQKSFEIADRKNNFDCEAMLVYNKQLYLFTKRWNDFTSSIYRLPCKPGNYVAELIRTIDANGLITGADISPEKQSIVLSGYKNYTPYMILCPVSVLNADSSERFIRVDFPEIFAAQTEGICFDNQGNIWISAEQNPLHSAGIYRVNPALLPLKQNPFRRFTYEWKIEGERIYIQSHYSGLRKYYIEILDRKGVSLAKVKLNGSPETQQTVLPLPDFDNRVLRLFSGRDEVTINIQKHKGLTNE